MMTHVLVAYFIYYSHVEITMSHVTRVLSSSAMSLRPHVTCKFK